MHSRAAHVCMCVAAREDPIDRRYISGSSGVSPRNPTQLVQIRGVYCVTSKPAPPWARERAQKARRSLARRLCRLGLRFFFFFQRVGVFFFTPPLASHKVRVSAKCNLHRTLDRRLRLVGPPISRKNHRSGMGSDICRLRRTPYRPSPPRPLLAPLQLSS